MTKCPECLQDFSRRDVMLRHCRTKHKEIIEPYSLPPPPPPPPPQDTQAYQSPPPQQKYNLPSPSPQPQKSSLQEPSRTIDARSMLLYHPFTMMISGPTACGKTAFVKKLLQQHDSRIQSTIHRIVFLYKRWQPLYTLIKRTVTPTVQFIQGIPSDLDDDDFFDPRLNNLLVLDDLFSQTGKDKRISELFTEGSHHRSLSVISINQNLYGNKDPTQRRNCHYLVLFNNPVDRQSIMTLARQMYPGHSDRFMKSFQKATKHPYGYLFVDFKPFTKEEERLKYNMSDGTVAKQESTNHVQEPESTNRLPEQAQNYIKGEQQSDPDHFSVGVQTVHIEKDPQEGNMADKAQPCDDCGLLFDSVHDVQRHVKRGWCPENSEPPAKKPKTIEMSDEEIEEDIEENEGYLHLWGIAQKQNIAKFNTLYEQYIDDGYNDDDASEMASERTQPHKEKFFFGKYQCLLEKYWLPLTSNKTHRLIVDTVNQLRNKGLSLPSAVKRALKKYKKDFTELFEIESSDDDDESDDDDDDDESDDDENTETVDDTV